MRYLLPKTKALLVAAICALSLVFLGDQQQWSSAVNSERIRLDAVDPNEVVEIQLSTATQTVLLSRDQSDPDAWSIVAPIQDRADRSRIMTMLMAFRKGVIFDAFIDSGDDRRYGMDASTAIALTLKNQAGTELISVVIGKDTEQGSSYVRLANSDKIYRAQLGRRHRFALSPEQLRNQLLIDLAPEVIDSIEVLTPSSVFSVLSEPPQNAQLRWSLTQGSEQLGTTTLDQQKVLRFVRRVGRLRIGRASEAELLESVVELQIRSGESIQLLKFSAPNAGRALVALDDEVYEVASTLVEQCLLGLDQFLDRRFFRYSPRQDFDTISLKVPGQEARLLQQDLATGFWKMVRPSNLDTDPRQAFFAVNTLSELEAVGAADPSPVTAKETLLILTLLTGQRHQLRVYAAEGKHSVVVLDENAPVLVANESLDSIAKGFGMEKLFRSE